MGKTARNLRSFVLPAAGIGLSWSGIEAAQLLQRFVGEMTLSGYSLSLVGMTVAALAVVFLARRNIATELLSFFAVAAAMFGALLVSVSFGAEGAADMVAFVAGVLSISAASMALDVAWVRLLVGLDAQMRKIAVLCAAMVGTALILVLGLLPSFAMTPLLALFLTASAGCVLVQMRSCGDISVHESVSGRSFKQHALTLIGVGVTCACFGFWQTMLVSEASASTLGNVVAIAAFFVVTLRLADSNYAIAYRLVNSLMLAAFVALAMRSDTQLLPSFFMATAFSVFEYAAAVAVADLVAAGEMRADAVIGSFFAINCAGQLAGGGMGLAEMALFPSQMGFSLFGLVLVLLLIASSVWWITEPKLNALFRGAQVRDTLGEPTFDRKFFMLADECGLSEREREVALPFAKGRSSSFIAEQLYLSSSTVRTHLMHAYEKLDVHSRQELISRIEAKGEDPLHGAEK